MQKNGECYTQLLESIPQAYCRMNEARYKSRFPV